MFEGSSLSKPIKTQYNKNQTKLPFPNTKMLSTITIILAALAALGGHLAAAAPADTIESRQLVTVITGFSGAKCGGTSVLTSTGILSPGLCYTTTAGDINSYRPIASALLTTCTATFTTRPIARARLSPRALRTGSALITPPRGIVSGLLARQKDGPGGLEEEQTEVPHERAEAF